MPDQVAELVKRVQELAQADRERLGETRSMLVKGFPFSVVYRASKQEVLVVAIAPHRKRPQYWASRIEG